MGISMVMTNRITVTPPPLDVPSPPSGRLKVDPLLPRRQKDKVLILMGATGTGKSRLSIDLATRFPAEIINSDKMQVYDGLDIVTNKITEQERNGVPHHLLGTHHPNSDFTARDFREMASVSVESVFNKGKLPVIVGGSNSYIEALVDDDDCFFRSKYECCFIWVDVSLQVLNNLVSERVDRMVGNGMVDELRRFFHPEADYSNGVRRAIGVPEFELYFKGNREWSLMAAIQAVKDNTCRLACRQSEKISRLRNAKGWKIHRVEATEVFRNKTKRKKKKGGEATEDDAWEQLVAGPSTALVAELLYNRAFMELPPGPAAAVVRGRYCSRCLVG